VNNAGIGMVGGIEETGLEDFQRLFKVNVEGTYLVTRAAMPLLIASHGCIVNIGSVAGLVGIRKRFAYCATKGAVVAMTRQLAVEYATQVRVNCICPGTVDTLCRGVPREVHKHEKEEVRAELNQRHRWAGWGDPTRSPTWALPCRRGRVRAGIHPRIDGGWRPRSYAWS